MIAPDQFLIYPCSQELSAVGMWECYAIKFDFQLICVPVWLGENIMNVDLLRFRVSLFALNQSCADG